jgi:UDP-2-acetamido-3-amino-2,3-dideoxy-glucuronate N-acetyltransferase
LIADTAIIGQGAYISSTAQIWDFAHIREKAKVGNNVVVGQGAYVGVGVEIQDNCKIQNYAMLYEPVTLEQGVFIGPRVIFTNDKYPRAITFDFKLKSQKDWEAVGVYVKKGASIGAGSICIAPIEIGQWSMIAAGSVVTKNVPDFAQMMGSPAKLIGWVGPAGRKLVNENKESNIFICPITKDRFEQKNVNLLIKLS